MNFLNFSNWHITEITEQKTSYFVQASYKAGTIQCPQCLLPELDLQKYGIRLKNVRDAPAFGKTVSILLKIQRYKCLKCNLIFTVNVPEIAENSRCTKRLISYIELRSIYFNFRIVANETGVSEVMVRSIFDNFWKKQTFPAFETPVILGIDDVYINRKSCCILTDIENKRVFDILPSTKIDVVYKYLMDLKDKENIELVTMDMSRHFASSVIDALSGVDLVIDKFHVQRMANKCINIFLRHLRDSLNLSKRRVILRDRFLLLRRPFKLFDEEKQTLLEWRRQLPELDLIYRLKEEFLRIWQFEKRVDAEIAYSVWQEKIPSRLRFVFKEILTAVENWDRQIFNYFDYGVTNAFTESANNLVKRVQKEARGCSFEIVRTKILCRYLMK